MMRGDLVFVFDALIATWCVAVVTTQAIGITTGSGGVIAFVPSNFMLCMSGPSKVLKMMMLYL